ncbi:adenosylcobalamin-dependent ribonucleoside-diphosphate reductase [Candidatus Pacearchaeota archaeon]|nr:adenosylcobalamin-dependent ribonucleoside-diphosphate reductase [Candidatus Pacearchaeota archaeon]
MAQYNNGLKDGLNLPQSSVSVLEARYLVKDNSGNIVETGEDMMRRVAKDIAVAEILYLQEFKDKISPNMITQDLYELAQGNEKVNEFEKKFFEIMSKRYFLPNSPTLMNAGRRLQQLSACFVLPIEDSMDSIFETQKSMAMVHKSGGGTGFSFARLRPNGAFISTTGGYSPGPLSFLFGYNENAGQITQGGKRRGANMGIMRANHPDALCWARAKEVEGRLKNFNLSIAFNDDEIEAIKNDEYILMDDPREGRDYTVNNAHNRVKEIHFGTNEKFTTAWKISEDDMSIIDTHSGKEIGKVKDNQIYLKARELFNIIVDGAWKKGEPGIIFLGRMNQTNPTPEVGEIESTNPCGEQPLLPYESCNLGSINLSEMINSEGKIDEILFEQTIRLSTRFLDNVIDRNKYSLQKIEDMTKANRKIGLGVMGFAHMLIKMGVSYSSPEAVEAAEKVMKFINDVSKDESRKLAKEKGEFPNFSRSIYKKGEPIRNATTTTIAPTGTTGVIVSTSQGIEPIFKLITLRNVKDTIGKNLVETDRMFKEYLQKKGLYNEEVMKKMEQDGLEFEDVKEFSEVKDEIKRLFVTAHEVPAEQHLKIQSAFQKYTDNAVSKTINMPNEATKEDVANAYIMAYDLGCKGLTIYRDKSREFELLTEVKKEEKTNEEVVKKVIEEIRGRDIKGIIGLKGVTYEMRTGCGPLFITINYDKNGPVELFANMNPPGGCAAAQTSATGIVISRGFHKGVNPRVIAKHYRAIRCPETNDLLGRGSCSQAIAKALDLFERDFEKIKQGNYSPVLEGDKGIQLEITDKPKINNRHGLLIDKLCPECKSLLEFGSGCKGGLCNQCGWSEC